MKHTPLTQASFRKYSKIVIDGEMAARRLLDCASLSVNATDGTITTKQCRELQHQAKRTLEQTLALIEAIDRRYR